MVLGAVPPTALFGRSDLELRKVLCQAPQQPTQLVRGPRPSTKAETQALRAGKSSVPSSPWRSQDVSLWILPR